MPSAGDVILVKCQFTNPPKEKFAICVCPEEKLFFFINSQPRRLAEAQVEIQDYELDCLSHNSHVDTSKVVTFSERELETSRHLDHISTMLKLRIKTRVREHPHLPKVHADLVGQNF